MNKNYAYERIEEDFDRLVLLCCDLEWDEHTMYGVIEVSQSISIIKA